MGMTIDGQIKALEYLKKCGIFPFSDTRTGIVFNEEYVDGAIDTMRKYQKIVEIVSAWKVDTWTDGTSYDCMVQISEVVDDGNDD